MKKGFTLIELLVAVGLLAMIIAFSSIVFKYGIDAYRRSAANAEIMQKARAITQQLNDDLRGIRKDAPMMIWFEPSRIFGVYPEYTGASNRLDQILFFADGYFSSFQLYRNNETIGVSGGNPINARNLNGNLARIQYSLAKSYDQTQTNILTPGRIPFVDRILSRRLHILTADPNLYIWPDQTNIAATFGELTSGTLNNELFEHDSMPLAIYQSTSQTENDIITQICFDEGTFVDTRQANTLHKLMSESVSSFSVQWVYWDRDNPTDDMELRWFPSHDPDNDDNFQDSHFNANGGRFGVYFNMPNGISYINWDSPDQLKYRQQIRFPADFYPAAMKFTFRIHDSKNVLKAGRTFSHIIYLDD